MCADLRCGSMFCIGSGVKRVAVAVTEVETETTLSTSTTPYLCGSPNYCCLQENAGENNGFVWLDQDADQCPGLGSLTVRKAGSDKHLPEVRVTVTW